VVVLYEKGVTKMGLLTKGIKELLKWDY